VLVALARVRRAPAAARALRAALTRRGRSLIVLANGAFFVSARPLPADFDHAQARVAAAGRARGVRLDLQPHGRRAARARGRGGDVRGAIRGLYAPEDTVVITELGNARSYPWLRHAMFYLPEYAIYELRVGDVAPGYYAPAAGLAMTPQPDSDVGCPPRTRLVWFVDSLEPGHRAPRGLVEIELPTAAILYVLPLGKTVSLRRLHAAPCALSRVAPRRRCLPRCSPPAAPARALRAVRERPSPAPGLSARRLVDPPALRAQPRRGRGFAYNPAVRWPAPPRRCGRCCSPAARLVAGARSRSRRTLGTACALARRLLRAPGGAGLGSAIRRGPGGGDRAAVVRPHRLGRALGMEVTLAALLVAAALLAHAGEQAWLTGRADGARDDGAPRAALLIPVFSSCLAD
jgi:hypothetical protein